MLKRKVRFAIYIAVVLLLSILMLQSWWYRTPSYHTLTLSLDDKATVTQETHHSIQTLSEHKFDAIKNVSVKKVKDLEWQSGINATQFLPPLIVENVHRFLFFVGYARSGHSIIASMLDAHPHIVIAHEYSLFSQWKQEPKLHSDKRWLLSTLYTNSKYNSMHGLRTKYATKKGYSLAIPNWWQGKYDRRIHVIGDKAGGMTAQMYRKSHTSFMSTYHQLEKTVGVPISVIHVLRNPYDNIATMVLYNTHMKQSVNVTNKYVDDLTLTEHIISYFKQVQSVVDMIKKVPLDAIEVHAIDLISNPKVIMRKICNQLRVECMENYLHMCAVSTYVSESRSRELVHWTASNIQLVAEYIQKFNSLKRYDFVN